MMHTMKGGRIMRTDAIFLQYGERIIKEASPIADLWCGSAIPKRSGYFRRVDGI